MRHRTLTGPALISPMVALVRKLAPPPRRSLWVPRTSSTSRDQAIFMDESADPIRPIESGRVDILQFCWGYALRLRR
jgi:hypothetical protein